MPLGAVFDRELASAPRTQGLFISRAIAAGSLLAIVATCWLVVTGSQPLATAGDTARFAATLFRILAPLQFTLAILAAALTAAVAVSIEKERRTLELLLVSRLGDTALVVGKLAGSMLKLALLLAATIPIFALASLFGGIAIPQVVRLFAVTAATALAVASVAGAVAFWKDTTFQALAITAFVLVGWLAAGEAVAAAWGPDTAAIVSPARGLFAALAPEGGRFLPGLLGMCGGVIAAANGIAVANVRRWNTSSEIRRPAMTNASARPARAVWSNPVLWREICTRAHGRAMIVVRIAWLLLFTAAVAGLVVQARAAQPDRLAIAAAVVPMVLASLLAVAALAVTSITTERDRGAFDLLLVSDLEPGELVWGKLLGVLVAAREIVALPLLLCGALVATGVTTLENGLYLALGLAMMTFFTAVLGVYAGLSHPASRPAIAVALGTVAFLFVGVATAMRIMVAFGGSFELQLAPFLAVIVGGGVGLYAALAARNPSPAIGWASALLPALTFTAIASFLQGNTLQVFLVVLAAYGFATLAMLVPAIAAFDLLTGRTTSGE
jgi:ABC-type transport system involved in multi-copper enzyme maturation permease subunit